MIRCMGCMAEYGEGTEVCPHCGYVRGTPAREAYHLSPESILGGRYIVGRVLGFGGFGVTYIGWDAQLDRVVAIKEFLPTTFATRMPGGTAVTVYEGNATTQYGFGLERFVEEAQRLAQFNGIPGITDIYDTFSGNNTAYIVMQFLKGRDVKEVLSSEGPMPFEKARDIVLRVCETLAPVHAKGVIHRDISPDNIYLTDEGEVKLLDFGAARYESSVNSKSLSVILKAGYAPEEQYRSRGDQGPWTDVYALAATFYKMLTGVTPPDSMERAVKDEIREPSKLGSDIPQSAENALMNALNIRKSDRTQSVEAFKAALQGGEVERVKVKATRVQTGRVPVPAIVGMALAGVLLVAFIVLSSTGVINMGGNVLEDTFGSPVAEGNALVPGLSGKTEVEAKKLVEDAGLLLQVGEPQLSDSVSAGGVMTQEPLPGRQLELGGTVKVGISAGSLEDAIAAGLVPDLVGMDAAASVGFTQRLADHYVSFKYEYSDTMPAGSVARYDRTPGVREMTVYVSAGPDNGPAPYGQARAPMITTHDQIEATFTSASASYYVDGMGTHHGWNYLIAEEGTNNWQKLYYDNTNFHASDEDMAGNVPPTGRLYLRNYLLPLHERLDGKTIKLRVEHYGLSDSGSSDIEDFSPRETLDFTQTIHTEVEDAAVTIEKAEVFLWEEVESLLESGEISAEGEWARRLKEMDVSERDYTVAVRLTGDFKTNSRYFVGETTGNSYYSSYYPEKQGVLDFVWHNGGGNTGIIELAVLSRYDVTFSEDGMGISVEMDRPVRCTLQPFEKIMQLQGANPIEAAKTLREMSTEGYVEVRYATHETVPAGQVITWGGHKEPEMEQYYSPAMIISVGPHGGEANLVLGPSYETDELYARYSVGGNMGGRTNLYIKSEYSMDGGATWEADRNSQVYPQGNYSGELSASEVFYENNYAPYEAEEAGPGCKMRLMLTEGENGPTLATLEFDMPLSADAPMKY